MAKISSHDLEKTVYNKFNKLFKKQGVTLEKFQVTNTELNGYNCDYSYSLKYKNNVYEYHSSVDTAVGVNIAVERIMSEMTNRLKSVVVVQSKKEEYLATQADALEYQNYLDDNDKYLDIYKAYKKLLDEFNGVDNKVVLGKSFNEGFKVVFFVPIEGQSISYSSQVIAKLQAFATKAKNLWDVCKKNNYVVNSDGNANGFPCHITAYDINNNIGAKYINFNQFRSSKEETKIIEKGESIFGYSYNNGEFLLNEYCDNTKGGKHFIPNLLAPPKENPNWNIIYPRFNRGKENKNLSIIYKYIDNSNDYGAPFGVEVSKEEFKKIKDSIEKYNQLYVGSSIDDFRKEYSCLIYDDCNFGKKLISEIENARNKIDGIDQSIASNNEETKRDLLAEAGMPPTLGDLFKTIMCHLETFTHMVFTCSQTIYNQIKDNERTPDKLHIDLNDTDIINYDIYNYTNNRTITPVTPFPGIFRKQDYSSANKDSLHPLKGQPPDGIKSMSWTGEIDKNLEKKMEETLLVESIYNKITSVYDSIQETAGEEIPASYNMMPYPILPTDLTYSSFPDYASDSIDGLSAYLTFRYSLLDLCANHNTTVTNINTIGKLDGFNYWKSLVSKYGSEDGALASLKNLNDVLGGLDKFRVSAEEIMLPLDSNDDRFKTDGRYVFEQYKSTLGNVQGYDATNNRFYEYRGSNPKIQRLLGTSGNGSGSYIAYRYAEDLLDTNLSEYSEPRNRTNKLIPIGINNFEELKNRLTPKRVIQNYLTFSVKNESSDGYFVEKDIAIYPYPDVTIDNSQNATEIRERIINETMFKVFTNNANDKYGEEALRQVRDSIIETYKLNSDDTEIEVDGGGYKITINIEDIKNILLNVKDDEFVSFYNETNGLSLIPGIEHQNNGNIYFPTNKNAIELPTDYENGVDYINLFAKMTCDSNKLGFRYVKNDKRNSKTAPPTENGDLSELRVRQFEMYVAGDNGNTSQPSLFGTPFYYQLNEGLQDNPVICDRAKAFLYLHTFRYDVNNIYNADATSSMIRRYRDANRNDRIDRPTISPYGGLLLEGALIWRYRHWVKTGVDPLSFTYENYDNTNRTPDGNCGFLFDNEGRFIVGRNNFITADKYLYKKLAISKYYNLYQQNTLERMFIDFVNGDWQTIKEKSELKNGNGKCLSIPEFKGFVNTIRDFDGDTNSIWGVISGKTPFRYTLNPNDTDIDGYLSNFVGNYISIGVSNGQYLWLHVSEDIEFNSLVQKIYFSRILFYQTADNDAKNITHQRDISRLDRYLDGFGETLKGIYNANSETVTEEPHIEDTTQLDKNVDLRVGIYMYIKNLWDRWLLHNNNMGDVIKDNPYSVRNYFTNFVFCDSFYRNMYNMTINMEHAANMISNDHVTDAPKSLHSYLGDIACENKCMFFALPDTIDLGNPDTATAFANMNSMFVPYTWKEKKKIHQENTFVVMHTYPDGGVIGDQQKVAGEGFDLYAFEDGKNVTKITEDAKELFKRQKGEKEDALTKTYKNNPSDPFYKLNMQKIRYGYNVPSFGVAFSRQNNSIFKSINLNMDTPMVTEVYSKTYEDIINKASGNTAHVTFYGQDIYPVFQNYSYECEVEMMGNAQVTPMMYIQLLNIPLFNGAYMIKSVQHDMKPGYMTTRFKAIKMSKRCPRYVDSAYVETDGTYGGVSGGGSAGGGTYIDTSYGISYGCNGFDITKAKQGGYNYKMPSDKAYPGKTVIEKPKNASSSMCVAGVWTMLRAGNPKIYPGDYWTGYSAYLSFEKNFVTGENQLYKLVAKRDHTNENDASIPYTKKEWQEWFTKSGYCNSPCCVMFMTKADYLPRFNTSMPMSQQTEYRNTIPEFNPNNYTNKTEAAGHGCWWDNNAGYWVSDMIQYYADEKPPYSYSIPYKGGSRYWRLYVLNEECVGNGKMEVISNIKENTQNQEKNEEVKKRGIEVMTRLHNEFSELTVAQAAGIAGVWGHESGGWNPNAYYEKGNSAFGLAQWEKIRTGGSETNHEGDFVLYLKREKTNEYEQIKNLGVNEIHEYFKSHYKTIESQIKFAKFEMKHIPQFTDNNGNKCNVLGNTANYSTSRVYNTGNILSVTAPYDSDHSKNTYEDNKNAIDDVVRRFLLGYEMQNQPPSPHAVHMEERCGYAKIAFDLAIKNKIWS